MPRLPLVTKGIQHCRLSPTVTPRNEDSPQCDPLLDRSVPVDQVTLQPSGLALDGSGLAVSVAATGGNKSKLKAGVATFKDVVLHAEHPGKYQICAKSTSRAVSNRLRLQSFHLHA